MKGGGDSGRGLKVGPWLTFLGFLSSLLLYECVCGRARGSVHVGEFFVMREYVALGSPSQQGKFNKTYLTRATWLVSQQETDEEGETDKEGKDQHLKSLSLHPATQITIRFVLMLYKRLLFEQEGFGRWVPVWRGFSSTLLISVMSFF